MRTQDALNILGLKAGSNSEEIKAAYRTACRKYHPDVNPAGKEMMQAVNEAYTSLKDYQGEAMDEAGENINYGAVLNDALNAVINLNLNIEICGAWIWVSGNTRVVKDQIKTAGYKYASKKKMWYFRPEGYKSKNRKSWSIDKIRREHGTRAVRQEQENSKLAA